MIKTEAIVLSVTPYAESSLVARLLTRQSGVARAMAKGARNSKSRQAGALEPFSRVEVQLHGGSLDRLATLGETTLLEAWPCLRGDLARLAYASLGLEILGRVAEASPPDPFYYEESCRFLALLGVARGSGSLAIALLLRLLHQGGFVPGWAGGAPPDAQALSQPGATVSCDFSENALSLTPFGGRGGNVGGVMRLPGRAVAAILDALETPPPLDATFELRAEDGPPLLRWLARAWEDHLGSRLKSFDFLEKMILSAAPRP